MRKRQSYVTTSFQTRDDEHGQKVLSGYFMKYDDETKICQGLYEKIDKQAVEKSLRSNDIRALFNHDSSIVLGRTTNGTLTLTSDDVGLRGDILINEDDPIAMGIYARIKRGDISGCSFGFFPLDIESIKREDGTYLDIIKDMDLLEVSPCTFPAYPQTEISARQQDLQAGIQKRLDIRKTQLKERFTHE
ncbi:HK97 family phage prohead protease [Carnobacteriaceae bacterium zg-ZUI78]|nr:HK97 family phage prohead protease [Carnobacteriaceae bacterium zg-ZUI78]